MLFFRLSRFRIDKFSGNTLLCPNILKFNYSIIFIGILSNLYYCKNYVFTLLGL